MDLIQTVKTFCITENPSNPVDFTSRGKLIGSWCPYDKTLTSQKGKSYPLKGFLSSPKEIKSQNLVNTDYPVEMGIISVNARPLLASDGKSHNFHNVASIYEDALSCLKTGMGDTELPRQYAKRIEAALFNVQNLRKALIESLKNCKSEDDDEVCEIKLTGIVQL